MAESINLDKNSVLFSTKGEFEAEESPKMGY